MAQSSRRAYYSIGDYVVTRQIGAGSFSTVWHARHRVHGTEFAIKEIATARLNPKLQESLKSEIFILKSIDHPNIIRLHDMIEEPGKIYIVLEYCKGGDLSMFIQQRHGKIPEATAKHFMQQLAEGLKVLCQNNLVHRDLKPQNLLLSANNDKSVLKIADFGFARPLQPWVLAETLCGSPLYMAPEIMQLQKYDAKADLWSVGAILFQLVTGKPPFTGSNQIQLLQNIIKSTELQFPPEAKDLSPHCIDLCRKLLRRNPVERLTFEEFFNHPYLSNRQSDESFRYRQPQRVSDGFTQSQRNTEKSSPKDNLPFSLDDDSGGPSGSPFPRRPVFGFSLDSKPDRKDIFNLANQTDSSNSNSTRNKTDFLVSSLGSRPLSEGNLNESLKTIDPGSLENHPKVMDSLEAIFQDYVIVSGPPLDLSSSAGASKPSDFRSTYSPPLDSENMKANAPAPAVGRSVESHISAPRSSQGSLAITNSLDQPTKDCMARIESLQHCATSISELVNQKIEGGDTLEAFSVELVILAIWKQALHICQTHAASAIEGSSGKESTGSQDVSKVQHNPGARECLDVDDMQGPLGISSQIETAFLYEVENAEELAKVMETGNVEMPDAMELIYQSALAYGRRGAVDEYMGNTENAVVYYSKAVRLLIFILVEAPCLILSPPFSLTNSDRYRIQSYVEALNSRQSFSQSQRMALFKAEDQPI